MGDDEVTEERVEPAVAQTSDPSGLEWLEPIYREHAKAVMNAAYRVTGNAADAEDVLQTVFIRLARRERAPDFSLGAWPYLRRAATNAALDLLRSRKSRKTAPLEAVPQPTTTDPEASPDRLQSSRELRDRLRAALGTLNRRNAEMFVLRYFEGLDNRQIAALFDTSPGTVAVTLHRVRARVSDELRPYLGGIQ
jgi:RNA polymerase sigma-70 factor (ECF subfamily)